MAKVKTILVPFESWFYLRSKIHEQRGTSGKPLDKKWLERKFNHTALYDGWGRLMDGDFGWSLEEIKRMLDEAGLPYKDTEDTEVIGFL